MKGLIIARMFAPSRRDRKWHTFLVALTCAVTLGSCGSSGSSGSSSSTSVTVPGGPTLPGSPTTLNNKVVVPEYIVSASGSVKSTWTVSTGGGPETCTVTNSFESSFKTDKQVALWGESTGQLVLGPFTWSTSSTGSQGSASCQGAFSVSHSLSFGPTTGNASADMLIGIGSPATVIVPAPQVASPYLIPIDTNGGPPFTWDFTSSSGISSGPGKISCKVPVIGDTVPTNPTVTSPTTTAAGASALEGLQCTTFNSSKNFNGTFTLTDWPCVEPAGAAASAMTVTCKASGTIDVAINSMGGSIYPGIVVTPATLHFPDTSVGGSSPSQTITILNPAGSPVPLVIAGIGVAGSDNPDYTIVSSSVPKDCIVSSSSSPGSVCPENGYILNPGQSATLQVSFTPQKAANLNANFSVVGPGGVYDVAMYGVGIPS